MDPAKSVVVRAAIINDMVRTLNDLADVLTAISAPPTSPGRLSSVSSTTVSRSGA
jgi:hypothetical protein